VGQATVGILLWDPETLAILEANAKAAELLGRRPRDLLSERADALFAETSRDWAMRTLARVGAAGAVRLAEVAVAHRSRGAFPAEVSASLVRIGDEAVVLALLHDLTETKALERRAELLSEQIRRTEKEASIGQLAAGIAHEINNPMGYVASNLNRLVEYSKRLVDVVDPARASPGDRSPDVGRVTEAYELVGEIEAIADEAREGVERVIDIVQALLEFAHGGPGRTTQREVDLNRVVQNCLTLVERSIRERVQLDLGPLPHVRCYPMQIAQVVMNLVVNGVQAIDQIDRDRARNQDGGRVRISTRAGRDRVHVSIEDDGCGIPEAQLCQVFDPFFTTKPVGHGTGLGLAVSLEIVRRHGGSLWVDSCEGRGSLFLIELPLVPPASVEPAPEPQTG
jgi:PAS domain S-box-containing protein